MKPGTRLKSAVCETEVMIIKAGVGTIECGGLPMVDERTGGLDVINPDFSGGTMIGKRYTDAAATFELLCVKPGNGTLSVDGKALQIKDAKPLPASD